MPCEPTIQMGMREGVEMSVRLSRRRVGTYHGLLFKFLTPERIVRKLFQFYKITIFSNFISWSKPGGGGSDKIAFQRYPASCN